MPTYVYETIPEKEDEQPVQFEIEQRMTEKPLTEHPETGQPVQRIISGGLALPIAPSGGGDDCCNSGGCGCG